jgi:hypothetical protein
VDLIVLGVGRLRRSARTPRVAVVVALSPLALLAAAGVARATVLSPRLSAGRTAATGRRVAVVVRIPRRMAGETALLQERSGRRWIVRDGGRVSRTTTRLWFRAPSAPQSVSLRVELIRARRVTWRSPVVRVAVHTVAVPVSKPPAAAPIPTPRQTNPTTPISSDPTPAPGSTTSVSTLTAGQDLTAGQELQSPDGQYTLVMQADGNLVLYQGAFTCQTACTGDALWNSQTEGDDGAYAVMQTDGNLVVYQGSGAVWNSQTEGFGAGTYLSMQNDFKPGPLQRRSSHLGSPLGLRRQ